MPPIPGIENAVDALTLYDDLDKVGKRVAIIGGGLAGCETGLNLAATGHEVTVIEMQERMAPETFSMPRAALLNEMDKQGIRQVLGRRCTEISAGGVKVVDGAGNEEVIEADTVCVCIGMKSCSAAAAALKAAVAAGRACLRSRRLQHGRQGRERDRIGLSGGAGHSLKHGTLGVDSWTRSKSCTGR